MPTRSRKFTKRKLFTYRFSGRLPRALLWRKSVYSEWFEYGLLHQQRGGKLPVEFGYLPDFKSFEEWWRHPNYGFELFCEPYAGDLAKVVRQPPKELDKHELLMVVSLVGDREQILRDFERSLRGLKVPAQYQSKARFRPSREMKYIKPAKLASYRETYLLSESLSHREVVINRGWIPKSVKPSPDPIENRDYESFMLSALRRVSRHRKTVLETFKNLEKGTFP